MNPHVDHPRWSQATEQRIGESGRRPTLMFNGYAEQVGASVCRDGFAREFLTAANHDERHSLRQVSRARQRRRAAGVAGVGRVAPQLGANPVNFAILTTGMLALVFLMLTLLVTPLRKITGWNWLIFSRRTFGLYAFFYGCLHFLIFFGSASTARSAFPAR